MPPIAQLTSGVLERIMAGDEVEKPVLQILGIKRISGSETERLRLLISDGKYFNSMAMLATQLNQLHSDGKLKELTIVQVDKYITSLVNKADTGKRVLVILELTVLNSGDEVGHKIGEPVSYTEAKAQPASKPTPAPAVIKEKPSLYNNQNNNNNNTLNSTLNSGLTHPIASLSPYQNKWVIKVRVTAKTAIRTWSNAKGEGKLFSMNLADESGEIRATAFKEQCDKFYDMIEVDRVYYVSKCQLKPANKQFSNVKNDYEMTLNSDTVIQLCEDDESSLPEIKYDLIPIAEIAKVEAKAVIDTIGICKEVGEVQTFTSRTTNKEFKKRDVVLVDSSDAAINLTLWGDDALKFDGNGQPVILVKGVRVGEFNGGKNLSLSADSLMKINPDIPEGHKLRGWFDNGGCSNISNMVSAQTGGGSFNTEWLSFHEVSARKLGTGDKPDFFQCKGVIHTVKNQNAFYKACPQPDCNKKVIDESAGHYRCERCNAVFVEFKYRLLINLCIADWTTNRWATCFSDVGELLLQRPAQEIGKALDTDPEQAEEILSSISFRSYNFKLRCKMEMYGDVQRTKFTVQSASPINYKEYNKYLIENLTRITGINKN